MKVLTGISQLLAMGRGAPSAPTAASPDAVGSSPPSSGAGRPAVDARSEAVDALHLIADAALVVDAGHVVWIGPACDAPEAANPADHVDLGGVVVMPGLVDPHTHLVFAGDRAADFEARARGESYEAIARRGGGIQMTARATRLASSDELLALARMRLERLLEAGVTTVEIKSGYGLSLQDELRQLEVIRRLSEDGPQRVVSTLLLHVIPPEFSERRDAWIDVVRHELLPEAWARRLADHVDVYCERTAFSPDEAQTILASALGTGFEVKAHTEQFSASGFGVRAAHWGALSLEHLEHASDGVIAAMARSGTRAVLLPSASLFVGDAARPPVAAFRRAGVKMALGTDLNPGTSPTFDPWLVGTLACTWYGMTPVEALRGMTVEAARALGLENGTGTLTPGAPADFIVTRARRWEEILYGLGHRPVTQTWIGGIRRT